VLEDHCAKALSRAGHPAHKSPGIKRTSGNLSDDAEYPGIAPSDR
jgi:hypothetical protein